MISSLCNRIIVPSFNAINWHQLYQKKVCFFIQLDANLKFLARGGFLRKFLTFLLKIFCVNQTNFLNCHITFENLILEKLGSPPSKLVYNGAYGGYRKNYESWTEKESGKKYHATRQSPEVAVSTLFLVVSEGQSY